MDTSVLANITKAEIHFSRGLTYIWRSSGIFPEAEWWMWYWGEKLHSYMFKVEENISPSSIQQSQTYF